MKYAPVVRLSSLRPPRIQAKIKTVNYLEGFWRELFLEVYYRIRQGSEVARRWITTPIFIILVLTLCLWPRQSRIIYAEPIPPAPAIIAVKPLALYKTPAYAPQTSLETMLHPLMAYGTYGNSYAAFNCTQYVASRLPVPQDWGDAGQWAYHASLAGYTVSAAPKIGSIATNATDSFWGHVAVVADISNGMVRLEEQNYEGPGLVSTDRWAAIGTYEYIYF